MKVVIVESPNKCATIKRYLGDDYQVMATKGHVRDLATSGKDGLGVDCENGFKPSYIIIKERKKIIEAIKNAAKKADEVILATDPDREGEAIAWHLSEILKLNKNNKRLEFHEITRNSITEAIKNPRTIDLNLVSSQEARRIVDRIIGFRISNLLQRNNNLLRSGGRVQSATLKLIVDHEREILNFKPEEFYSYIVTLKNNNVTFDSPLYRYKGKEIKISSKEQVDEIINATGKELKILSIKKSEHVVDPKAPFTTSTLQQAAITHLGWNAAKVTTVAQQLYEGINVGEEHMGLITYIRTDDSYLSETYIDRAKAYIKERFGENYIGPIRHSKSVKNAQKAHEAIRPTSNHRTPASIKAYLDNNQYRLYQLIYNHTLAYLMTSKREEITTIIIGNDDVSFKIEGKKTIYYGYEELTGKKPNQDLPFVSSEDMKFEVIDTKSEQKFTQPPARYSEAKIIGLMEEKGIGRPSTYSSTISTLKKRNYILREKNGIKPTDNGIRAIEYLEQKFPNIVDTSFTAQLEKELDEVEEGEAKRTTTINKIYKPFMQDYMKELHTSLGDCPNCGSPLKYIKGRYGYFIGCSNYPNCDYIKKESKPEPEYLDRKCPLCGSPLKKCINKKNKEFIGCSNYPKCHYIEGDDRQDASITILDEKCPKCGSSLISRKNRRGTIFIGCSNYPKCHYIKGAEERLTKVEIIKKCPDCGGDLILRKNRHKNTFFLGCSNFPKCRHIEEYNPEKNENK